MANPPIVVRSYDAATGNYICDLPVQGLQFGSGLNGSGGTISGRVNVTDPKVKRLNPWAATVPGRTILVADMGGQILEAYFHTNRGRSRSRQGIMINASPMTWQYARQKAQSTDYSTPPNSPLASPMTYWTQQVFDASLVGAQVFLDAMNYRWATGGIIPWAGSILGGLTTVLINGEPPNPSNPVIPQANWVAPTFPLASIQSVDAIFQQLTSFGYGDGIDFNLNVYYTDGPCSPIYGVLNIWYPRAGRLAVESGITMNLAASREADFPEDATQQGTAIIETGVQSALYVQDNTYPLDQGWPPLDKIVSHSGVIGPDLIALLQTTALSDSYLSSFPPCAPTVQMPLYGLDPAITEIQMGDDCLLWDDPTDNFPQGFQGEEWRIVGWNIDRPDEGDPTINFTLNTPPAATAVGPTLTG